MWDIPRNFKGEGTDNTERYLLSLGFTNISNHPSDRFLLKAEPPDGWKREKVEDGEWFVRDDNREVRFVMHICSTAPNRGYWLEEK
ncbi:MAG: hypothetical protein AAB443_01095 [Patescibacteria group bacterium]